MHTVKSNVYTRTGIHSLTHSHTHTHTHIHTHEMLHPSYSQNILGIVRGKNEVKQVNRNIRIIQVSSTWRRKVVAFTSLQEKKKKKKKTGTQKSKLGWGRVNYYWWCFYFSLLLLMERTVLCFFLLPLLCLFRQVKALPLLLHPLLRSPVMSASCERWWFNNSNNSNNCSSNNNSSSSSNNNSISKNFHIWEWKRDASDLFSTSGWTSEIYLDPFRSSCLLEVSLLPLD